MLCVEGTFNIECLLIEFVIPNLRQIYFCIREIFKTIVLNRLLSTNIPLFYLNVNLQRLFCNQKAGVKLSGKVFFYMK